MKYQARLLITVVLISIAFLLGAEPISQLRPIGYVNDFAHVLNREAASQLEEICLQIDQKARAQIAVVTVNSLDGSDIEGYAVDLFKKWGIGNKATNRGVLILLAVKDRRYRIEVGYGLEPILPDGKVGGFGREAVPYLRNSDYDGALLLLTSRIAQVIAEDAGVQISTNKARPPTPSDTGASFPIGTIVFVIIVALLIFGTPLRSILFWWLLFDGGRRRGGWGGWSSGGNWGDGGWGRGGFGGGGGFGGFGGGSSGGGGASGSW